MALTAHSVTQIDTKASSWGWQLRGACRHVSPETFFHPDGERGTVRRTRDERAKAVCSECPVLRQCRDHVLTVREPFGVWGGMTEVERAAHYLASPPLNPGVAV